MIGHVARFYTSVSSLPVCACAGVSTLSSSTLFLFFRCYHDCSFVAAAVLLVCSSRVQDAKIFKAPVGTAWAPVETVNDKSHLLRVDTRYVQAARPAAFRQKSSFAAS